MLQVMLEQLIHLVIHSSALQQLSVPYLYIDRIPFHLQSEFCTITFWKGNVAKTQGFDWFHIQTRPHDKLCLISAQKHEMFLSIKAW